MVFLLLRHAIIAIIVDSYWVFMEAKHCVEKNLS